RHPRCGRNPEEGVAQDVRLAGQAARGDGRRAAGGPRRRPLARPHHPRPSSPAGAGGTTGWLSMATARVPRERRPETEAAQSIDFTIITGLSGAGRSEAAKSFEDLGYFVVDNLPPALIGKMAELAAGSGNPARVAIVADVRGGVFFNALSKGLQDQQQLHVPYRIR